MIVQVDDIGKSFKEYRYEIHRVLNWFGAWFKPANEVWTLKNISFNIGQGECVGLVGKNGAGKSTLLKILTKTLQPTTGCVRISGRVSAILELGMGFDPELTARQNAFHAASLMGLDHKKITSLMPEVEDFSEIGDYFDQPMRVFSSGMHVRVAFAVATMVRPDVLIIDEALSVGDSYFQHKSFARIRKFSELGTTLLLVSHDRNAIQSICQRALLLEEGSLLMDGSPEEVFDLYNSRMGDKKSLENLSTIKRNNSSRVEMISGTKEAEFVKVELLNSEGKNSDSYSVGELVCLKARVKINKDLSQLVFGYSFRNRMGQIVYGTNTFHSQQVLKDVAKGSIYEFESVVPLNLGVGSYALQVALTDTDSHLNKNYEWRDCCLVFDVINDKDFFQGLSYLPAKINFKELNL